jgi:hypothetical protein
VQRVCRAQPRDLVRAYMMAAGIGGWIDAPGNATDRKPE